MAPAVLKMHGMALTRTRGFLLLALATVLAYFNTLHNQFVWDDLALVCENSYIRDASFIPSTFTTTLYRHDHAAVAYYRPLQVLSYALDYRIWRLDPFGYHLTNLLLHLLCVFLVNVLIETLTKDRLLALFVSLLFAVHPVNTNAVAYVAGRADMLSLAAMLVALRLFICSRRCEETRSCFFGLLYSGAVLCFVAALFSRESALLFPMIIFIHCVTLETTTHRVRHALLATAPFLLLAISFLFWRSAVIELQGKPLLAPKDLGLSGRVVVMLRALGTYLGLLVWPAHLEMGRQVDAASNWFDPLLWLGGAASGALVCAIGWSKRHSPTLQFALCWFVVTLLPSMGLLNLTTAVAEHWLYVPAIGFYLAVGAAGLELLNRTALPSRPAAQRIAAWSCVLVVAALAIRTIIRNRDWATPLSIHTQTNQAVPENARVLSNLGREHLADGNAEQALQELLKAEQLDPSSTLVKGNLAAIYYRRGNLAAAERKLRECLQIEPRNALTLTRLASLSEQRGDLASARQQFILAISINSEVQPRLLYAQFLLRHSHISEALSVAREASELEPANAQAWDVLAEIYEKSGDSPNAKAAARKADNLRG